MATIVVLVAPSALNAGFYPFGDDWRFEGPNGEVSAHVAGNVVSNEATLLRLLTLRGRGIFLAPSFVVADELAAGTLVRLLPDYRPVEFSQRDLSAPQSSLEQITVFH